MSWLNGPTSPPNPIKHFIPFFENGRNDCLMDWREGWAIRQLNSFFNSFLSFINLLIERKNEEKSRCAIHEINSLPACLIGGLWALQRQWLRQREQTAGERELGWMNVAERIDLWVERMKLSLRPSLSEWSEEKRKRRERELNERNARARSEAGRPRPFRSKSMKSKMNWIAEELGGPRPGASQ